MKCSIIYLSNTGNDDGVSNSGHFSALWTPPPLLESSSILHPNLQDASSGQAPTLLFPQEHATSAKVDTLDIEDNNMMTIARDGGYLDMAPNLGDLDINLGNGNVV
jgi:hypothetical protein